MRIISKLILFIFVITATFGTCVSNAQVLNLSDDEIQQEFELLNAIGVLTDEDFDIYEADELLMRKELAVIICRLINADVMSTTLGSTPFPDVPVNDPAAPAIKIACDLGILHGYGNGLFGPEDSVSYEQAVKTIVSALGYELYAQSKGGYPFGYMTTAVGKGIIKGISSSVDYMLTKSDFVHLVCNSLDVDIMKQAVYGEISDYAAIENRTILSEYLKIEKGKGIVSATMETGLSTDDMLDENEIQIDSQIFQAGNSEAEEYLGYEVTYYASVDEENDEKILLYIKNEQEENDEIIIQAQNINEAATTRKSISYWKDEEFNKKPREISISPVADMIYNGKAYPSFNAADLIPKSGYIKLLDRNSNGEVDVIFVISYETMIVDGISTYSSTVYNKYSYAGALTSLELDGNNEDYDFCILKYGENILLEELKEWDVLSVAISKNSGKKKIEIQVCDDIVDGTLKRIQTEDTVLIDDTEYKLSKDFICASKQNDSVLTELKVGANLIFRLDIYGDIAYAGNLADKDSEKYGYLFKMSAGSSIDEKVLARIFTEDEKWVNFEFAKYVEFNGAKYTPEGVLGELAILNGGNIIHVDRQLVLYELNGKGEIKTLKTAKSFADILDEDLKYGMQVQAGKNDDFWVREQCTKYYRSTNRSFGSEIYLRSNVKIFIIPTQTYADDEDNYFVEDVSYFRNDNSYTFTSYAEDEYQYTSVLMINDDITLSSRTSNSTTYNNLYVVDEVATGLIGEDIVQQLYGVVANQTDVCVNGVDDSVFESLNTGDVVQLRFNRDGRVDDYFKIYKVSEGRLLSNKSADADGNRVIVYGNVTDTDIPGKRIKLNDGTEKVFDFNLKTPNVTVYNHDKEIVEVGKINDIEINDFLIMRIRDSGVADIVIYKNY